MTGYLGANMSISFSASHNFIGSGLQPTYAVYMVWSYIIGH